MTFSADSGRLPDVNLWIAIAADRHVHHELARQWFDSAVAPGAVAVYRQLASDERVHFAPEPLNTESAWISLMSVREASGSTWTDAYLAAFALEAGFRLISFDKGMRHWPALALEVLRPA
jgi:predicted nucleic acid-binding protein